MAAPSGYGVEAVPPWSLKEAAKASNGLSLWLTQDVYRPGDRIEGRLKAQVSQRTTVRAARVKLEGEVYVHWHTGSGKDRHDYHKRVPLFDEQVVTVFGAAKGDSSQAAHHLEPQQHYEWAFSLTLPGSLPPSISLREGTHVQYRLTGFLDIPNWPDSIVAHNLDVAGAPLAEPPAELRSPVDRRDVTPVFACCCCLRKGDAVLSVSLQPNSLLAFDEARGITGPLNLTAGIHNSSTRNLEKFKAYIKGEVTMTTGYNSHGYAFIVAQHDIASAVPAGHHLPPQPVPLPPLTVKRSVVLNEGAAMVLQQPSFDAGGILQLKYYLGVCAENGCCNVDPQTVLPLLVVPTAPAPQPQEGALMTVMAAGPMLSVEPSAPSLPASLLQQQQELQGFTMPSDYSNPTMPSDYSNPMAAPGGYSSLAAPGGYSSSSATAGYQGGYSSSSSTATYPSYR